MTSINTPLSTIDPPVLDEKGKILPTRIKDVDSARNLWVRLRDADFRSNVEMAKHQALADGEPPYDQCKRKEAGQAYLANFNPNDMKALLDTSLAQFTDLISADETLIELYTTHGTEEQRDQWSTIMSKKLSQIIRSWPQFMFQFMFIPHYFVLHGVGIVYFPDCYNWQWEVTNLAWMKIPRGTKACEEKIPYAFVKTETNPVELIRYVENPEYAEREGWNIKAIKKALLLTRPNIPDGYNWMEVEQLWKNNDIYWSETAPTIPVVWGWVQENDGSYSVYAFTEGQLPDSTMEAEDFLCCKRHAYKNATEAFIFFTRGIGTNGTYHAIRGLAADIYNAMQALMRLENRKYDIAFESGPMWQVADEEQLESAQTTPWGAGMLVSRGVQPVTMTTPNMAQAIEPAVTSLRGTIQQNVGTYTSANALQAQREMTKAETLARLEQTAALSVTSINLFNAPQDRLAREIGRRFTREGYLRTDPGGHYVQDWKQECIEAGVPEEALHKINHRRTRASRVIGFGSAAARRVSFQMMMELYPLADERGKLEMVRDLSAATVGWEKTNVYFPPADSVPRPPVDAAIADLQNQVLSQGGTAAVMPNENRTIHLEVHIAKIGEYIEQFNEAGQNPELYPEIVPPMQAIYEHAAETLEGYTGEDAPMFRQALQQTGEIVVNGLRHMQKLERQQMEEQQRMAEEGGGEFGGQPDPATQEQIRRTIEWQSKLEREQALFQQDLAQNFAKAQQDRYIKDLDARAKILRDTVSAQARMATQNQAA